MGDLAKTLSVVTNKASDTATCPVARIINKLDDEDRQALTSALNSAASTRGIHSALRQAGHAIDRQSVQLHREQRCRCNHTNGAHQ